MRFLSRLTSGLSKSAASLSKHVTEVVSARTLSSNALEALEEALIMADMGVTSSAAIIRRFSKRRFEKNISEEAVKKALAEEIAASLLPYQKPLQLPKASPAVVMLCGVNGNGKTTTAGKLAERYTQQKKRVMLAACDTFRAAAVAQLETWASRAGAAFFCGSERADPASVAYQALEKAKKEKMDVLLLDTAGRLHNKEGLMEELQKIVRVLKKLDENAPHEILLVLDATTGQNALTQAATFSEKIGLSGLIVTKLDGTAKAGIVLALAEQSKIPIVAIGVGESVEDLQDFEALPFASALIGA